MEELKSIAAPLPTLWFGGFIVTQALSPIDTSGNVPGEGQICCRIKLIYQMIECESKATLLEKMQKGLMAHLSSSHDTWMTWQSCILCVYIHVSVLYVNLQHDFPHLMNWFGGVQHYRYMFLWILQNVVSPLRIVKYSFKSRQSDTQPATISGFAALAADVNHHCDIEQMEMGTVGFCSDSWRKESSSVRLHKPHSFSTLTRHVNSAFCSRFSWSPK